MKINNIRKYMDVGGRIKAIPTFLFLIFSLTIFSVSADYQKPDFAFPQTVEERSDSLLKIALAEGNQLMVIRNAMNLNIAYALLKDSESLAGDIMLLDSISKNLEGEYRSLCYLIEAQILKQTYEFNPRKYDSRNLPLDEPFPLDPMEWSGGMYKEKIYELVEKATDSVSFFRDAPIQEIKILLSDYESAIKVGLTVPEFILFKGEEILKGFVRDTNAALIPFYPNEEEGTIEGKCKEKAKYLLLEIMDQFSKDNSVVCGWAKVEMANLLPDYKIEDYLKNSIKELEGTEGEGILLYEYWKRYREKNLYGDMITWLSEYPAGYGSDMIGSAISEISQESIQTVFPKIALPYRAIKGKVTVSNLEKGYLLIYKLKNGEYTLYDELIMKKFTGGANPVQTIEIKENGRIPFDYEKKIEISGLQEGVYVVIPSITKSLPKGWNKSTSRGNYTTFRVSDIAMVSTFDSNEKDSGKIYVVKGSDQQPVAGAVVSYYQGNSNIPKGRLTTNKEGYVKIPNGYYRLEAIFENSVARREAGFSYYPDNSKPVRHVSILTDLSIYRPGDTIRFAVLGWLQDKVNNTLLSDCKVNVSLRDANYIEVDNVNLTLDQNGRTNGILTIPEGRLSGNYTIEATYPDFKGSGAGYASILVEEYKLPAFQVLMEQKESYVKDQLWFKGSAYTYSGMPVTNANVDIKIQFVPWRWGYFGNNASYSETVKTDEEGNFTLELPTDGLRGTIFESGRYSITAEVTSEAGETEKSRALYFSLGKGYDIRPSVPDKIKITGDSITFNVPVYDIAGLPVRTLLNYKISNIYDSTYTFKGEFNSPLLSIPAEIIPSGKYRIEFKETNTGSQTSTETVMWRENETKVPYPTSLWIPQEEYIYNEDQQSVKISFGSYWNDWLLTILSDGDKVIETKWIAPEDGLYEMNIEIPENNQGLFMTVCGMHDFQSETGVIRIIPKRNLERMSVRAISFRENISCGDEETWSFKFSVENMTPGSVNAFAVMTDKALNALREFKWSLNIFNAGIYNKVQLNPQRWGSSTSFSIFGKTKFDNAIRSHSLLPDWETYGYPFVSNSGIIIEGARLYKAAMTTRNAMMDLAAGDIVTEASDEAVTETTDTKSGIEEKGIELRPVEMPSAFFMPDLESNDNGELTIKFRVPNFNTTWQFQLAGYNRELMNTTLLMDAVAAKQVMVKSNLPQFLRTGDKAEISATLYNNSDSVLPVTGKFEIVNPLNGEILAEKEYFAENVAIGSNRVISIRFDVPDNISVLAVRSYGLSHDHSDGEQGFIPVLPSSVPVIESTTFYAKSKDENIEIKVPKLSKDANVTLKYCDNPLWEVLLAIPGFIESTGGGALSNARWLYGTLTSLDIINGNKQINEGLKKILESDDSTLSVSNLYKDLNLKIASPEATPWLNNANSETTRIRSLGKYFDRESIMAQVEIKTNALRSLQNSDGGFSWFEGMKSSPFITSEVINILAYLKNSKLLQEEMEAMAQNAVRYYDRYLEETVKRYKVLNITSAMNYLYSRNRLGYPMSKSMKKIEKECLDSITSQWRRMDIGWKAKGALILLNQSEYRDEANLIASSLKQFIGKRISIGQEALMLELFEKTEPEGEAVERIFETMLLQKETEDWGSNISNAGVIHALIGITSPDMINRRMPEIYIGDELIDLSSSQGLTGNFTVNLDPKRVSGKKITIRRKAGLPSWGGIVSQFVKPIKDIRSSKVENLSIEKRVLSENEKGVVKEVKTFKKGDKVTVVLNITCGKDMDYVVITDSRSACLQPDNRISGVRYIDGLSAYQEISKEKISFFIENLPAGKYVISYECHADRNGEYGLGTAETQCLYSPAQIAHSAGGEIIVGD